MNDIIPIENKVSQSQLITIDLQDYVGNNPTSSIDLSEFLENGFVLREKAFRSALKMKDWSIYQDHNVNIYCSTDALVPSWAYMLLISKLIHFTNLIVSGSETDLERLIIVEAIEKISPDKYSGKKVVVKGCGTETSREFAYTEIAKKLLPSVDSLMYGEPCSTVPVYKKK